MPSNARQVRDALESLNGKIFDSREDFENSLFPIYPQVANLFHGEHHNHRALTDMLIGARWLDVVKGKWVLTLPAPERFSSDAHGQQQPSKSSDPVNEGPFETPAENNIGAQEAAAMVAIVHKNYKEAIRILSQLL